MAWTLQNIITKVRKLTGSPSTIQISDADITDRVNNFYRNTLPLELRPDVLNDYWRWNTIGAYQIAAGDGVTRNFSGTLSSLPSPGGVGFTDGNETFEDDGLGILHGSLGGSGVLNYVSRVFSIQFDTAPVFSAPIGVYFDGMIIPDDILRVEKPVTFSGWFAETFTDPKLFWSRWPTYQPFASNPPNVWAANTQYNVGAIVQPSTSNGFFYRCVSSGLSNWTEPVWNTAVNGITADGQHLVIDVQNGLPILDILTGLPVLDSPYASAVLWLAILAEEQPPIAVPYLPNTPAEILIYGGRVTMRPTPDQVYLARFSCIKKPPAMVYPSDTPFKDEWGKYIALGTALDIAEDNQDTDLIGGIYKQMEIERSLASRPDLLQLSSVRAMGRF